MLGGWSEKQGLIRGQGSPTPSLPTPHAVVWATLLPPASLPLHREPVRLSWVGWAATRNQFLQKGSPLRNREGGCELGCTSRVP